MAPEDINETVLPCAEGVGDLPWSAESLCAFMLGYVAIYAAPACDDEG